jgi:hypothetical protein
MQDRLLRRPFCFRLTFGGTGSLIKDDSSMLLRYAPGKVRVLTTARDIVSQGFNRGPSCFCFYRGILLLLEATIMATWHPANESPTPPDWFVKALRQIDPTLRVVWAMERYLRAEWAIERKMSAERYWLAYESFVTADNPDRYIDQPVFDHQQPIKDELGNITGYVQVGTRKLDLAPEYEHIAFRPHLNEELLTLIRRLYWERDHPEEVAAAAKAEKEAKETAKDKKTGDEIDATIDKAYLDARAKVQFGYGAKRNET